MRDLLPYLKLYKKHWFGLSLGMLLAFLTLAASVGLLTLSGWFISAAAVAGLTIARETFNYMLPGAGVRGAAMARTAGRWGERVVSHNATFKLLTDLRIFFFDRYYRRQLYLFRQFSCKFRLRVIATSKRILDP